ncbi:MAG: TonB-dependent receptor [Pseudomonadota bacterium]
MAQEDQDRDAYAEAAARQLYVPAGPLNKSLIAISNAYGLNVIASDDLVVGKTAPVISGLMGAREALGLALAGSRLVYTSTDGAFIIAQQAAQLERARQSSKGAYVEDDLKPRVGETIIVEGRRLTTGNIGKNQNFNALGNRPILDTPFSVTSFTSELVESTVSASLRDILTRDPSVSSEDQAAGFLDEFTIRGFSVGRGAFIYDGLPNLLPEQGFINAAQLERVEVFRGANSIIAGASTTNRSGPGGAINVVPKRPGAEPVTSISAAYLSDSAYIFSGDLSRRFGPGDQFGARLVISTQDGELAVDNVERQNDLYSLYVNWRPTEIIDLNAQVARIVDVTTGFQDNLFVSASATQLPPVPDPRRNYGQPWTQIQASTGWLYQFNGTVTINDDTSVTAGYGVYDTDGDPYVVSTCFGVEEDGRCDFFSDVGRFPTKNETFSIIANTARDIGGINLSGSVGYSRSEVDQLFESFSFAFLGNYNILEPQIFPEPVDPGEVLDEFGGFSGGGERVVDTILVKGELRAWNDRIGVIGGFSAVDIQDGFFNEYEQDAIAPFATVSFKPTENSSLYTSYTEGLEVGGIAPAGAVNEFENLEPITSRQIEAGAKVELGSMLATAAIFQIERDLELLNSQNVFVQDGRQVHRGVELQVTGEVLDGLELISGFTYLDAEIEDNGDPAIAGNRPPGVPKLSASIFADYQFPFANGLSVNGGLRYEGPQFVDLSFGQLSNAIEVDSFIVADFGVAKEFETDTAEFTLRFFVNNIFDENYWEASNTRGLVISSPRTLRASITAAF